MLQGFRNALVSTVAFVYPVLHQFNMPPDDVSPVCLSQVQSEFLSTALAIAALRRCFPTSALVVTWMNRLFHRSEVGMGNLYAF